MVRTKADSASGGQRKAIAATAPRKVLYTGRSDSPASSGANKYSGGNPVCQRPTPEWQKGIASFLSPKKVPENEKENCSETSQGE